MGTTHACSLALAATAIAPTAHTATAHTGAATAFVTQ